MFVGTICTDQGATLHDDGDHLLQQVNSSITSVYFLFINAGCLRKAGWKRYVLKNVPSTKYKEPRIKKLELRDFSFGTPSK
jgi:hypothetical protein